MTTENNAAPSGLTDSALKELSNIANAKRFDREYFEDDTSFADWVQSRARALLAAAPKAAEQARPVAYHFHRFVDGEERAEDILIERARSLESAIKEAVKCCLKRPMTVLVHAPAWVGTLHGGALVVRSNEAAEQAPVDAARGEPNHASDQADVKFEAWWERVSKVYTMGSYDDGVRLAASILTENAARAAWSEAQR